MNYPLDVPNPERTERTPWTVGDFLMVLLGGSLISVVAALAYANSRISGIPEAGLEEALVAELSTPAAVALSLFAQMVGYLVLVLLLGKLLRRAWDRLRIRVSPMDIAYLGLGVGIGILLSLVFGVLAEVVGIETGQGIAETASQPASTAVRIATIFLIGLMGPATEETVFRGVLLSGLENRFKTGTAIGVSAAVFAAIHVLDFGDQVLLKTLVFVPELLIIGVLLAALTVKHNRLGPAIFTHIGFNSLSLLVLLGTPA